MPDYRADVFDMQAYCNHVVHVPFYATDVVRPGDRHGTAMPAYFTLESTRTRTSSDLYALFTMHNAVGNQILITLRNIFNGQQYDLYAPLGAFDEDESLPFESLIISGEIIRDQFDASGLPGAHRISAWKNLCYS